MKPPAMPEHDELSEDDRDRLSRCLESGAPDLFGGSTIREMRRSRFEHVTSYDTWLLTVGLAHGGSMPVFLKDYGFSIRRKDDPKARREREVCVYREILRTIGPGTARYYGSLMDEDEGRLWLLLEYVEGTPVDYCKLGDDWAPGAEGLGRMHGCFARRVDRLRACDFLVRHDAEFFLSTAERALRDVRQVAPQLVGRVEKLVRGYTPVVDMMTAQEPSLVHGGCRPSNILVRVRPDPSRVCILDWEEAALGAPLFDVAHLLDGVEPPLLDRLLEAYRNGASQYQMWVPPLDETKYLLDCFRLHMAFDMLGRSVLKGYSQKGMLKLMDYGERVGRAVYERRPITSTAFRSPVVTG